MSLPKRARGPREFHAGMLPAADRETWLVYIWCGPVLDWVAMPECTSEPEALAAARDFSASHVRIARVRTRIESVLLVPVIGSANA